MPNDLKHMKPWEQAKLLRNQSVAAMDAGRHDEAVQLAKAALGLCPGEGWLHAAVSDALTWRHDYWNNPEQWQQFAADGTLEEAISHWHEALRLGVTDEWVDFSLGHALTALGRFQEAVPHLRRGTDRKLRLVRPDLVPVYDAGEVRGPDFLIIGATKCGTTSLYEYLCAHPQILPAVWKEPEYYRFPERGLDWYLAHLPRIPRDGRRYLTGEASSCYLSIAAAPDRILTTFPKAKLIVLMRDPVDKAISHCHHDRKLGCEHRTVDEALNRELDILEQLDDPFYECDEYWKTEKGYVWLGLYAYMLHHWVTKFPREQVLAIPSEDLWGEPKRTVAQVFGFLGLPDHQLESYEVHLQGKYDKSKPEPVRERLQRFFAEHNELLYEQIGRRLDWQHPEPGSAAAAPRTRRHPLTTQPPWERVQGRYDQSRAALAAGRFAEAEQIARELVAAEPGQAHLHANLADALTHNGSYWTDARKTAQFASDGTLEHAIEQWQKALALGQRDEWTGLSLARALVTTGRTQEAALQLRKATDHQVHRTRPDLLPAYDTMEAPGPDFLLLGAMHCETERLYRRLCAHPKVLPAILAETDHFRRPGPGVDWYTAHFPRTRGADGSLVTGEMSNLYLSTWHVQKLVHASFPAVRLVVLLRDPVDRAIEHCLSDHGRGLDPRDPVAALNHELDLLEPLPKPFGESGAYWQSERGYVWHGLYAPMLENWLREFPREQLLVLAEEEVLAKPGSGLAQVFAHLGLSPDTPTTDDSPLPGRVPPGDVPAALRDRLRRFYAAGNERLGAVLGRRLPWQHP